MNYIRHLNAAMEKFVEDDRINPSHISLYLSLFQKWNINRFENPLAIIREDMMALSKIGSRTTYLKCLHELSEYKYLEYQPSKSRFKTSKVYMFNFCTSREQDLGPMQSNNWTRPEQDLGPNYIKNNKQYKLKEEKHFLPPAPKEIKSFFQKKKAEKSLKLDGDTEAQKFYNHYKANGWMIGKNKMQDWQAAAENWILKTIEFNGTPQQKNNSTTNHLHTNQNKDYSEPL